MKTLSDGLETAEKAGFRQAPGEVSAPLVSRETGLSFRWMTDRGLCLASGAQTLSLYHRLTAARLPGVVEWVPADGSLLAVLAPGASVPELAEMIKGAAPEESDRPVRTHTIPARFDGEDLPEAARRAGLKEDELVGRLCALALRVKFLGFQPGFAYLEGLPPELQLPRRASPRKRVPAGSLALGGAYCGIYPASGPGGWHLLGRCELVLFDPVANPPARLQPGDRVRLVAA